jgi:hypothetical protein
MREVAVIAVERKNGSMQTLGQVAGKIALPCSGGPGDADEIRVP